jgi:hypothetical protein
MRANLRHVLSVFAVCAGLLAVPSVVRAAHIIMPDGRYAPITFSPNSVLIAMKIGQVGMGQFRIDEEGFKGPFRGRIDCMLNLFGKPRVDIDKSLVTITVPKQMLALDVGCGVTVRGEGNRIAVEPVLITVKL